MQLRARFLYALFMASHGPYARVFKRRRPAWDLSAEELRRYPVDSLGHRLGLYLDDNGFELLPRLENHDVFHVITDTPTDVRSEIGLQFLLRGNGRSSLYLLGAVLVGGLIMPEHLPFFLRQHARGAAARRFHDTDFLPLLSQPVGVLTLDGTTVTSGHAEVVWAVIERFSLAARP